MRAIQSLSAFVCVGAVLVVTAAEAEDREQASAIVNRALYAGVLADKHADFRATYDIESFTPDVETRIPLVAGFIGLTNSSASSRGIRITREGRALYAVAPGKGKYRVQIAFSVALENMKDAWKTIVLSPGPALIRKVDVVTDGDDSTVELEAATSVRSSHTNSTTRVTGYMGSQTHLRVRWQAKARETKIQPVVICNVHQLLHISATAVKATARFVYDIPRGSIRTLFIDAPATAAIVNISGEQLRDWTIDRSAGRQSCLIELIEPVSGRYTLDVIAEQPLGDLPDILSAPQILAAQVARQEGTLALVPDEVVLKVTAARGLNRIDSATAVEAAGWTQKQAAHLHSSYRFPKPDYECLVTVDAVQPNLTAVSTITAAIEDNRTRMRDRMSLDVRRAGVFSVSFDVPPDTVVTDVKASLMDDWKVTGPDDRRRLEVLFKRKVLGRASILLVSERTYETLPDTLLLSGLLLRSARGQSGSVAITPFNGIAVREKRAQLLRTVAVDELEGRTGNEQLGYSFRRPDWELALQLESLRPTVSCDVFNLVTLGDGFLGGSATINYTIENAGLQELVLLVPESWQNVDILGQDIKRRTLGNGVCRVVLQDRVMGRYPLVITYDQPFDPSADIVSIGGIRTSDTSREIGYLAVASGAGLQVSEADRSPALRPIDSSELPDRYQALIENTVLKAYNYVHQPYHLKLQTTRHKQQQMLDAVADHVKLITVVAAAGRRETQATYLVNNSHKDALRVTLPEGADLWSVFVNNRAIRPEVDGNTLIVPLRGEGQSEGAVPVEFTYVEQGPRVRGFPPTALSLAGPVVDLPASYVQWELYLPQWIHAGRFAGTMRQERGYDYTISAQLDLASANIQKVCRSHFGGTVAVLVGVLFTGLLVAGVKAGAGQSIATTLVAVAIGVVLFAIAMPSFVKARNTSQQNACINNLRQIDSGKEQCALAMKWTDTNEVDIGAVNRFIKGNTTPECPSGGRYIYGRMDQNPTCTCAGHHLKDSGWSAPAIAEAEARRVPADRRDVSREQKASAMSVGLLPVRVAVPKEGHVWLFSKVLHTNELPVRIETRLLSLNAIQLSGIACSVALLVVGIAGGWRGKSRSSLAWTTLSAVSLFMSVAIFFLAQHILYYFIMGIPTALVLMAGAALWCRGPVKSDAGTQPPGSPPIPRAGVAGRAVWMLALLAGTFWVPPVLGDEGKVRRAGLEVEIRRAEYVGAVADGVARFRAKLAVAARPPTGPAGSRSRDFNPATKSLFGTGIAVQDLSVQGKGARFFQTEDGVVLHLSRPGEFEVLVDFVIPVLADASRRRVTQVLPAAVSTVVDCLIDDPHATVGSGSAVSIRTQDEAGRTRARMVLGPVPVLDMEWAPERPQVEKPRVAAFCKAATRVHVSEGALTLRSAWKYQVTQGEMLEAKASLPDGLRLLKVSGAKVKTWELRTDGGQRELVVAMKSALQPADVLEIHAEITCGEFPCAVDVPIPAPIGVHRSGGMLAIDASEDIEAGARIDAGLQQIDIEEFPAELLPAGQHSRTLQAFRFWKPQPDLRLTVNRIQPDIRTTVTETLKVGDADLLLDATMEYDIRQAGVFGLQIALPAGYEIDSVGGEHIEKWIEQDTPEGKTLRLDFVGKIRGKYTLALGLRKPARAAEEIVLMPVVPLGAGDCRGFVAVSAAFGTAVSGHKARGLTPIPVKDLPAPGKDTRLAFSFRQPDWTVTVLTERSPAWVQAEGTHVLNISEGRMCVESDFHYSIQNAPVDLFDLAFPTNAENIRITGDGIRERGDVAGGKTILLQSRISGSYHLAATFDIPVSPGANQTVVRLARTRGPEREQGTMLISGLLPVHVTEQKRPAQALLRLNVPDLPAEVQRRAKGQSRLAYRYLRNGQELELGLHRYKPVEVLNASVEKAVLTSVLAEDGQMMTLATYAIRNTGRQYVRVAFPAGSRLWSCRVAGEAARTVAEGNTVLIPILPTGDEEPACRVQINYVDALPSLRRSTKLRLVAPNLDLPIQNTVWELYLPQGYTYGGFQGSARHRDDVQPVFREFGLSEYRDSLITKGIARHLKARELVSSAKKMVRKGDIKGARRQYKQARQADSGNAEVDLGLRTLSQIEARANVLVDSTGSGEADFNAAVQRASDLAAAVDPGHQRRLLTAQKQADRIRKAHSLPAAKTTQLQINLPIEGFRYVFEQILWAPRDAPVSITADVARRNGKQGLRCIAIILAGSAFASLFIGGCMRRRRLQILVGTILLGMLYVYIVLM